MRNSIRFQIFAQVSIIIILCVLALLLANSQLLPYYYEYTERNSLSKSIGEVKELNQNDADYSDQISNVERKYNVSLEIYTTGGRLIYPSWAELPSSIQSVSDFFEYFSNYQRNVDVIEEKVEDGVVFQIQQDVNTGTQYLSCVSSLGDTQLIEAFTPRSTIEINASIADSLVWKLATIVLIFAFVSVFWYSRKITNPIIDMNRVTKKMVNMDFSQKCTVTRSDELGELGKSINHLSDTLDRTLQDLKKKNERLKSDIEWERRQEQVRKEFISNVSHELKTPIAIIQGYAEGLEMGVVDDPESVNEYCKIIVDETSRMNDIVVELLELSKYEQGAYPLHSERFNVHEFAGNMLNSMKVLFEDKGITAKNDIDPSLTGWGDITKLEMVLSNYLGNAISHVKDPYCIRVSSEQLGDIIRVYVFNSGDAIAEEDMDKIWNSFYRADKSHNRSENRYGLGLSIVRAIQNMHQMKYGVENVEGGVRFWFDISEEKTPSDSLTNQMDVVK